MQNTTMQTTTTEAPSTEIRDPFDVDDVGAASDEELAVMADTARELLAACEARAVELEQDAAGALAAFEAKPGPDTLQAREICKQLARNARAEAQDIAKDLGLLFAEEKRRGAIVRLAELRKLDGRDAIKRLAPEFSAVLEAFSGELQAKFVELGQALAQAEAVRTERNQLEGHVGTADLIAHRPLDFEAATKLLRGHLADHFGRNWEPSSTETPGMSLTAVNIGGDGELITGRVHFPLRRGEQGA